MHQAFHNRTRSRAADDESQSASTQDARRWNRGRVLSAIRFHDRRARAEIAAFTGLTEAAVSRITRELIDAGILVEGAPAVSASRMAGRPQIELSLVGGSVHVLAFEIAANAQSVSLIDIGGKVVGRSDLELLDGLVPAAAIRRAADAGLKLIHMKGVPKASVLGAGVGIAGSVDAATGHVLSAPNIGWSGVPVASPLMQRLDMRVLVESRAGTLLLAEHRIGVARDARSVLLINVALGIGGAVMVDGRLIRGRHHAAGQIGHMPMPGGKAVCICSRTGCLDTLASGHAILARLGRLSKHADPLRHGASDAQALRAVALEAEDGDKAAVRALNEAGRHLGTALRWAAATLQPELIVLAGVPSRTGAYVEGVEHSYADLEPAPIAVSLIDNETAAGELALDAFVYANGFDLY